MTVQKHKREHMLRRTPFPSFCWISYFRSTCLSISSLIWRVGSHFYVPFEKRVHLQDPNKSSRACKRRVPKVQLALFSGWIDNKRRKMCRESSDGDLSRRPLAGLGGSLPTKAHSTLTWWSQTSQVSDRTKPRPEPRKSGLYTCM